MSEGIDLELSAVSAYFGGAANGAKKELVVDAVSLGKETVESAKETTLVEEHEVRPISAMNMNEVIMALKLGEQESYLWTMTDGFCNYVNYMAER